MLYCWWSVWSPCEPPLLLPPLHAMPVSLQYWHEHVLCSRFLYGASSPTPPWHTDDALPVDSPLSHLPHPLTPESFFSLVSNKSSLLSRTSLILSKPKLFFRSTVFLLHPQLLLCTCMICSYFFFSFADSVFSSESASQQSHDTPAAWWLHL